MPSPTPDLPTDPMRPLARGPLRLEPLTAAHADEMFPLLADPALYRYMDDGPPPSLAHLRGVYARLQARGPGEAASAQGADEGADADAAATDEVWLNWIIRRPDGAVAGVVQATVLPDASAWVAYVLGTGSRGRGWGRMATAAMVDHLVQHWGVRRLLAVAEAEHQRSLHLLRCLGFAPASAALSAEHGTGPSERLLVRDVAPARPAPPTAHTAEGLS